jgi:hypothetical protein
VTTAPHHTPRSWPFTALRRRLEAYNATLARESRAAETRSDEGNGMTYTAPASKLLTVLHIPGEDGPDGPRTRCGLPMAEQEMWLPVDLRAGDAVCRGCQGISDEEMTLC